MTEHGWRRDEWPAIFERVLRADILVLGTAIWLGEKTSVCTRVIERLYGNSHLLNDAGQYAYYGRVGGCRVSAQHPRSAPVPRPLGDPHQAVTPVGGTSFIAAFFKT